MNKKTIFSKASVDVLKAKRVIKNFVKNLESIGDGLPNEMDIKCWEAVLQKHFNQKKWDVDDVNLYMTMVAQPEDVKKLLATLQPYGLTDKNYYIAGASEMLDIKDDKSPKKKTRTSFYIHFPYDKIPSENFWRALSVEARAKQIDNSRQFVYELIAKNGITPKGL